MGADGTGAGVDVELPSDFCACSDFWSGVGFGKLVLVGTRFVPILAP
jgi:hypothetical protein